MHQHMVKLKLIVVCIHELRCTTLPLSVHHNTLFFTLCIFTKRLQLIRDTKCVKGVCNVDCILLLYVDNIGTQTVLIA